MRIPDPKPDFTCWILTDGIAGMVSHCRGLARAVGVEPVSKVIALRKPWHWLPPAATPASLGVVTAASDPLAPPWPDLLIASGRKSVAPARAIRRASGGRTFCVQVQNPRVSPSAFDLVVTPEHDGLFGPNVISTAGSIHGVNADTLADARRRFAARVEGLPRPLLAVLLGGSNAVFKMTEAFGQTLAKDLQRIALEEGWGLAVTASRRTPAHVRTAITAALDGTGADIWDETGDNPYLGFLAHADAVLVTGDSVNMVSEAAATGKPVHVAHLEGGSQKFSRFHRAMEGRGITRPFKGSLESWDYAPLDETAAVAAEVRRRLASA